MSGGVHWLVQSAAQLPAADGWLAPGELSTLTALRFEKRRSDWLLGRWTAKQALSRCMGREERPLSEIEIRAASDGAPEAFLGGRPIGRWISLSHSGDRALCALAPAGVAIGCDLETIEPRSDRFVRDYFTAGERQMVDGAPDGQRALVANLVWSAKESALKALREGLRSDTRSVELTSTPTLDGGAWRALELRLHAHEVPLTGWWRRLGDQLMTVVPRQPQGAPIAI